MGVNNPICSQVNSSMQELTKSTYYTREQHKVLSKNYMKRDGDDTRKVLDYLVQTQPFRREELINIISGWQL